MKNNSSSLSAVMHGKDLAMYFTAGFPVVDSTVDIIQSLDAAGVAIIEIGMPYSDPVADGPVIQQSNLQAIENGMTLELLFQQLRNLPPLQSHLYLMGYINPIMQFGVERFCTLAQSVGITGCILPDLPPELYAASYQPIFEKYGLKIVFLITPQTTVERIKLIDALATGFVYAVSSNTITGKAGNNSAEAIEAYLLQAKTLVVKNKLMVGFGIATGKALHKVCEIADGGIIGTAFIKELAQTTDVVSVTKNFIQQIAEGYHE
jgi:tryptophan synthase alpha chain